MIRLSPEQMLALQDKEMHRFARRVIEELPSYRPEPIAGRSRDALFGAVNTALERAVRYGIETERGLWLYANLAVTLGTAFDADPSLAWARDVLTDPAYLADERVDDLWNMQVDWCAETIGEGEYWPVAVLKRLAGMGQPVGYGYIEARLDLERLWPEKFAIVEERDCQSFIAGAADRAHKLGLRDAHAIFRFTRIAFVLGFAFDADPLHDWCWPGLRQIGTMEDIRCMDQVMDDFRAAIMTTQEVSG